jgi:hypothetical protein
MVLLRIGNFQPGQFPAIRCVSCNAGPIQKSGLPEVFVFSRSFFRLTDARIPRYMLNHG